MAKSAKKIEKIQVILYSGKMEKLNKQLGVVTLFSIASGAMISSGLFVLPSIAYANAGVSVILCYLMASVLMVPAMLSKCELSTAMPKSGGTYFYVNRSFGPLLGTFAGFTNWLSLSLKSAFALIGIGVFIEPLLRMVLPEHLLVHQDWIIKFIALFFTVVFTITNLLSLKDSGKLQNVLVFLLLAILIIYIGSAFPFIKFEHFSPLFPEDKKLSDFFSTVGLIFISYGGLTNIASVAAEVKNPGRSIPKSMIASFFVVSTLYVLSVFATIGLLNHDKLINTLTPLSSGAQVYAGEIGWAILALGAATAFITTANAGIMAASRNPYAMAQDKLIPSFFAKVSKKSNTPVNSILLTSVFMLISILFLDTQGLAKVASTMMLLLYILDCFSLIIMRFSGIDSYRPQFKSPLFPILQILGIGCYSFLIFEMGWLPVTITFVFLLLSAMQYFFYSRKHGNKESGLVHIVEKITNKKLKVKKGRLSDELREILFERDEIIQDRFDALIEQSTIIDLDKEHPHINTKEELFKILGSSIAKDLNLPPHTIEELLLEREKESSTNISEGLAIPHILFEGENQFNITVVRSKKGIQFRKHHPPVHIIFALAGSKDERNFHLKCLMSIAQIVGEEDFKESWATVHGVTELRNLIRLAKRVRI